MICVTKSVLNILRRKLSLVRDKRRLAGISSCSSEHVTETARQL